MDVLHEVHDAKAKEAILNDIDKFGVHWALVPADNYLPAFVYTIGLYKTYRHPEVIIFGLPVPVLQTLINISCQLVQKGKKINPGSEYSDFLEGYNVSCLNALQTYYPYYVGYACWFYKSADFPLIQLVWPDKQHRFPWETEFNPDWKFLQPLLDRNTDFLFYEPRNLGVYTTRHFFEGEPICYVYHNSNGDWQFHTSLEPQLEDAKLVALEVITQKDPTINSIFHLKYGWWAWRRDIHSDWEYGPSTPDDE